jgi:hypothetical protein
MLAAMNSRRRLPSALIIVAVVTGCSLLNREGPTDTCATLQNGAVNACKDGILATCMSGAVHYTVCDDKGACDQSWQTTGAYRCSQGEPSPGKGADGGPGMDGGPVGVDGGACTAQSTCVIASGSIDAIALDGPNVLFTDCSTVRTVPKAGGLASTVLSGLKGCANKEMFVDDSDAYVLEVPASGYLDVVRAPKVGGAPTVAVPSTENVESFAIDTTNIYWMSINGTLKAAPKSGGSATTLTKAANVDAHTHLRVDGGFVYWTSYDSLYRVASNATTLTAPSTIPIVTGDGATWLAVDGTSAFAGTLGGAIWSVSLPGGTATKVVDQLGSVSAITLDPTNVYWASNVGVGEATRAGSSSKPLSTGSYDSAIAADGTYVFYRGAAGLMRAPK